MKGHTSNYTFYEAFSVHEQNNSSFILNLEYSEHLRIQIWDNTRGNCAFTSIISHKADYRTIQILLFFPAACFLASGSKYTLNIMNIQLFLQKGATGTQTSDPLHGKLMLYRCATKSRYQKYQNLLYL